MVIVVFNFTTVAIVLLLMLLGGCFGITSILTGLLDHAIWFKVILIIGCIIHLIVSCKTRGVIKGIIISLFNIALSFLFYAAIIASLHNSVEANRGVLGVIAAVFEFLLSALFSIIPTGFALFGYSGLDLILQEKNLSSWITIGSGVLITFFSFGFAMSVVDYTPGFLYLLFY